LFCGKKSTKCPCSRRSSALRKPLRRVLLQVTKVAATDSTVLILGRDGHPARSLIARAAIHKRSRRSSRAYRQRELRRNSRFVDCIGIVRFMSEELSTGGAAAAAGSVRTCRRRHASSLMKSVNCQLKLKLRCCVFLQEAGV